MRNLGGKCGHECERTDGGAAFLACDPESFEFQTTDDLENLAETIGQERAVEALRFGVEIDQQGYNMFVLGPSGVGKQSTVMGFLRRRLKEQPTPADWCYVNNFEAPYRPKAISLPASARPGAEQ